MDANNANGNNGAGGNNGNPSDHLSIVIDAEGTPELTNVNQTHTTTTSSNPASTSESTTAANGGEVHVAEVNQGTRFDLQLFTKWLEQAFPFIFLLLLVWIYEHRNGTPLNSSTAHSI